MNLGTGKRQELCSRAGVPSRAQGPEAVERAPRFFPTQGEAPEEATPATDAPGEPDSDRVYLDLTPIKSFLYSDSGAQARAPSPTPPPQDPPAETLPLPEDSDPAPDEPLIRSPENPELQVRGLPQWVSQPHLLGAGWGLPLGWLTPIHFLPTQMQQESQEAEEPSLGGTELKLQAGQKASFPPSGPEAAAVAPAGSSPPVKDRLKATSAGACAR